MKGFSLEQLDHLFNERVATRAFKRYKFADDIQAVGESTVSDKKEEANVAVQGVDKV